VPTDLSSPDILMLVDQSVDTIILETLDDPVHDIKICLVVLAPDRLNASPVDTKTDY
jgi:hypothetical protein